MAFWRTLWASRPRYSEIYGDRLDFFSFYNGVDDLKDTIVRAGRWLENADQQLGRDVLNIFSQLRQCLYGRCFFVTESGRFGLGPGRARAGDKVSVLFWAEEPLLLRPIPASSKYQLLGDAWVDDLMSGAIFQMRDFEKEGWDTFVIR
jgi:hypothetical protein